MQHPIMAVLCVVLLGPSKCKGNAPSTETKEESFTVSTEPGVSYFVVNEPTYSWESLRTVTIKRVDKSGERFVQRQFTCDKRTANYLREGPTYESAQPVPGTYFGEEKPDPRSIHKRAKTGSITEKLLVHVCRNYKQ